MKDRLQIYVIRFLIALKMKRILLLFFTFLGICKAIGQKPAEPLLRDSVKKIEAVSGKRVKNDTLPGRPFIKLFPNPARNKVEIEVNGFDPGFVVVQIADQNGYPLKEDKRQIFVGHEIIVLMFSIKPGIYYLAVKQNKKLARTKLLVE